jgi:hypothetical protein
MRSGGLANALFFPVLLRSGGRVLQFFCFDPEAVGAGPFLVFDGPGIVGRVFRQQRDSRDSDRSYKKKRNKIKQKIGHKTQFVCTVPQDP